MVGAFPCEAEHRRLLFAKSTLDEAFQCGHSLDGAFTARVDSERTAVANRQHHEAHDTPTVRLPAFPFHNDVATKPIGGSDEFGGRPGVKAQLVGDPEFSRYHHAVIALGAHLVPFAFPELVILQQFNEDLVSGLPAGPKPTIVMRCGSEP
jgi:hypothetical protein